jgi:hypothetical protein
MNYVTRLFPFLEPEGDEFAMFHPADDSEFPRQSCIISLETRGRPKTNEPEIMWLFNLLSYTLDTLDSNKTVGFRLKFRWSEYKYWRRQQKIDRFREIRDAALSSFSSNRRERCREILRGKFVRNLKPPTSNLFNHLMGITL